MATPSDPTARKFYRAAVARLGDADALINGGRHAGAVYMAGYVVECGLKCVILVSSPAAARESIARGFRGRSGHDLDALRRQFASTAAASIPFAVVADLDLVATWDVQSRYDPREASERQAGRFLAAARRVLEWVDRTST